MDSLAIGDTKRIFSRDVIGGGPKSIAGVINQIEIDNCNIQIIRAEDFLFKDEEFLKRYDICLISAMTMDKLAVKRVVNFWRTINSEKIVIIGGPIASDSNILKKLNADIAVMGEGEKKVAATIKILINNTLKINAESIISLKNISGITFRYKENIVKTKPSLSLNQEEYNHYSNPKFFIDYIAHYNNYRAARIYVEILRGCSNYFRTKFRLINSYDCINTCNKCEESYIGDRTSCPALIPPGCGFCSTIGSFGAPKSRERDFILTEIKELLKLGANRILLGAPDFLDYKRQDLIEKRILTNPRIPPEPNYDVLDDLIDRIIAFSPIREEKAQIFIENVKASLCTDRALKILSKIPNCIVSMGCETGSDQLAKKLGRPNKPSEILKVIKKAKSYGIRVHIYFVHSLPGERVEDIKASIDLIQMFYKLGVDKITIYKYQDFPGAPFFYLQNKTKLLWKNNKKLNQYRKKLKKLVINFNRKKKEEMIGNKYRIFIAEPSFINPNDCIGYIIKGGPKVLIKESLSDLGKIVDIRIKNLVSDKLIEGEIILSNKNSNIK